MKHIESRPTGMHVVSVSVTGNTHAHSYIHTHTHTHIYKHMHILSSAMSVVKSLVVWHHVNTPLSGMVVVTLTKSLPLGLYFSFSFLSMVMLSFFHSATFYFLSLPFSLTNSCCSSSASFIYASNSSLRFTLPSLFIGLCRNQSTFYTAVNSLTYPHCPHQLFVCFIHASLIFEYDLPKLVYLYYLIHHKQPF